MSLPAQHRTPRLESLPEGLKAKAEAIIKKKFNIEDKKKPLKKAEKTIKPLDVFGAEDLGRAPSYCVGRVEHIRYHPGRMEFSVHYRCMSCGMRDTYPVGRRDIEGRDWIRFVQACRCRALVELKIDEREFVHVYRREAFYRPPNIFF